MNSSIIYALMASVLFGASNFIFKYLVKEYDLHISYDTLQHISIVAIAIAILGWIIGTAGFILTLKAFEGDEKVAVVSAIISGSAVFAGLFAFVFLGETLSAVQILGVGLMIASVITFSIG